MSKGIFKSLAYISEMIESITPKTDQHHGFISIDDGKGLVTNLNDRYEAQRQFTLELITLAMDDGSSGLVGRKRINVEIHIKYSIPKEAGFRIRIMNEDSSKIIDTIKGPQYNFNETGIVSVIPLQSRAEEITDINGAIIAHVLIIPFDLLYLEI
jgi:hypothetical protein